MTSAQTVLTAPPHRNQRLFSDHYLDVLLPAQPAWKQGRDAAERLAQVRALFAAFTPSTNEAQTENDLIRPLLALLGHHFEVQPALKTPDGTKRPDYVLYHTPAALAANKNVTLTDADLRHGLAVADAKYWDRPLDQALKLGADPFTNKNPSYQIAFYIQHTGLPWGILTNGRLWRLYHRESAHKLDRYYEIDLPELLEQNDPLRFQYFLRFFERAAFEPGPLSLEQHLQASAVYARTVGESLREQVYEALLHLGQGFLDFPGNQLQPEPAVLKQIYDNALILLYRLLFILYAEARDLLPVAESSAYRDRYSLHAIKRAVAEDLKYGLKLLPSTCTLWPRLTALFGIINEGSPPLKVATFNGGLFDPARHPFLANHSVGDAHLQHALDKLARVQGEFVDYRDLAERHLGTIYEGLLEFQLQPLPGPETAGPEDLRAAKEGWSVRLVTDRGERKASGSYYTPGFITRFMVEQAVGPVIDRALAATAGQGAEAAAQAVLNVNVLDCSMGSGHFLVEAVEYMARRLVEADLLPKDEGGRMKDEGEPAKPASNLHPSSLILHPFFDELAYWKRRVAQSCVYGVDLNPLAVDLAKLSLWLITAAKDRPLSFLDHHLRPGNALVGARLEDVGAVAAAPVKKTGRAAARKEKQAQAAGQLSWAADSAFTQSMSRAVGNMWLIEESAGATVADVKAQEQQYEAVRASFVRQYSRLANLLTATRFGLAVDAALWGPLADYASGRTIAALPQFRAWLEQAETLAEAHRFFHWELEFPEVFFDRFGRSLGDEAGFDVVIGNPPYVRQEKLAPLKPFFQATFASFHGVADLYLYFYEQGMKLLQHNGRMAYVSSGTFARANFAAEFRKLLPTLGRVETLVDFGENQPFEGAEMVRPSIVVLTRGVQDTTFRSLFISAKIPESLDQALAEEGIDCAPEALQQSEWTFQPAGNTRLFEKIKSVGRSLGEITDRRFYRGVTTGLNDAFVINNLTRYQLIQADPDSEQLIKPLVRGEDLRPWYQENEGQWLIFTRRGVDINRYPAVHAYLNQFRDQLTPRSTGQSDGQQQKGRKPGDYCWYEIQDSVEYHPAFERAKILWPDISKLPRFSWDETGSYCGNTGYILPVKGSELLGVLQSRVLWYAISQYCQPLRLRAGLWQYRLLPQFMARLPIPDMTAEEREAIGGLAMQITELARARYGLHQKTRRQIHRDLGTPEKALNQKLTAWWDLDFPTLRTELGKVFKRDIPVKERGEWDEWLGEQRAEHQRLTGEIIARETELNERVYRLFHLTPEEIQLIEESTKYPYGEV